MGEYNFRKIEKNWQATWDKEKLYKTSDRADKPKYYILDMFPYPSGEGLHVGHPKGYIATDVFARQKMMQGYNVLHPMGWDAFGLPAENYAIKNKIHPKAAVEKNIKRFKEQLASIGFTHDWSREVNTTDPDFYKWTQWTFLKMFEKGLAYESNEPVNWCPGCKTVLSNEDLEAGKCERCGSEIERKPMRQWVLKITDYADRMLDGLDGLDWEDSIKEQQKNWIGKSVGAEIEFLIPCDCCPNKPKDSGMLCANDKKIKVFTTRPDTLFGCTYVVLSPEHELIQNSKFKIQNYNEVAEYVKKATKKSDLERTDLTKEKTGVRLEGIKAINPVNGTELPIYIADYVLAHYGTGAIMAVPAHDERDFDFANKYGIEIKAVVMPEDQKVYMSNSSDKSKSFDLAVFFNQSVIDEGPYISEGVNINSEFLNGLETKEAKEKMIKWLEKNKVGKGAVNYKLNDWVFSRQRYWGEPIPLVYCEKCEGKIKKFIKEKNINLEKLKREGISKSQIPNSKQIQNSKFKIQNLQFSLGELLNPGWIAVSEDKLPVKLPEVKSYEPTGTGESPLAAIEDWVNVKCPKCGGKGKRETNTMPQWAGSSWYYLRYIDPKNDKDLVDKKKEKYWSPVDFYVGGAEHATRHLIYARFWHKFLFDIGVVSYDEPFKKLQHVGLIMAEDGRKMSKRWGNVINPDSVIDKYGADTLRVYEMFMGPFAQAVAWSTNSMEGANRFLQKVWKIFEEKELTVCNCGGGKCDNVPKELPSLFHKTIKKVTEDIEGFRFNTAISQMMILVNYMIKLESIPKVAMEKFLQLLAPFAPHICEELWAGLGNKESIFKSQWPKHNPELIKDDIINLVVQINGKLRTSIETASDISEEEAKKIASENEVIKKWIDGKEITKIIFVKGKLINIVMK